MLTDIKGGGSLEKYLGVTPLKPFINIENVLERMVSFVLPEVQGLQRAVKGLPADLLIEICQGFVNERPKYWGKLVLELVYEYLDPDVAEWLKTNAPKPIHGQNYHQWLNEQYGLKRLTEHIWMLIGMARHGHSEPSTNFSLALVWCAPASATAGVACSRKRVRSGPAIVLELPCRIVAP